ncbi:GlxA family transcriptional regulator [Chitinophaga sp. GCM10012297]|uniref:Helix-turn-helix domain-containing protein n=1 Tax=Chitinophaga chungangae TaxID=2821488 RepID=A0ABS3YBM7_9BACT|nr:helix-turn-helix domain-containing protein [Chitinophaga chungangae]MBO9152088.1 helix-turn-helix domain-containing protein [Chitinophaga chungangae]
MKHVSILIPRGAAALGCIEGAYRMFTQCNEFLVRRDRPALFDVQMVGISEEGQVYDKAFTVRPDTVVSAVAKTDLIIIPAVNGVMEEVVDINKDFLPWISGQYHKGSEVASLCVGAFLLASTGLLKGRQIATHWLSVNDFRRMFPDVNLVSDQIITDEQGIYSSGGANSFWNLLLHLVEKYTDREIAIMCAKYFAIEIDRNSQSAFLMFKGQKEHDDDPIREIQTYIEENYQEKITVDQLTAQFAISRRSLERRFKKATCNTVSEYIQRVKVEAAKKGFETSRKNITEIMYDVGYSDNKAFRTVFKKTTGLSPVEYRNKYNKTAITVE